MSTVVRGLHHNIAGPLELSAVSCRNMLEDLSALNCYEILQVLASNVMAVAWNTYLSHASHTHVQHT